MNNNIQGKVVVITGASSGLGEAAARELARHGAKHAVRVISDGLRQEVKPYNIQTTMISPGAVASEPPNTITDPDIAERMHKVYEIALPADSFATMVVFAMSQPEDVNEMLYRPTRQEY